MTRKALPRPGVNPRPGVREDYLYGSPSTTNFVYLLLKIGVVPVDLFWVATSLVPNVAECQWITWQSRSLRTSE